MEFKDNKRIWVEEKKEDGKQVWSVHFSHRIRPVLVISRNHSTPIIRLPKGTRASQVSRLDINSTDARQMSLALTKAADIADEMDR